MPRGREKTPVGHYGKIAIVELAAVEGKARRFEARCWFRDYNGTSRRIRAQGASKSAAENALKNKITEIRQNINADTAVTAASTLAAVGEKWLERQQAFVDSGDRSPRTLATYESAWRLHVAPQLGALRLREVTTAVCESWLIALRKRVGPAMCSTARTVLGSVLGYASKMDAIAANPIRDVSAIPGAKSRKRKPRAMTARERTTWLDWLDAHVAHDPKVPRRPELDHDAAEVIASRALGDITRLALGTGGRIGELTALSWDEVDLEGRTLEIRWHLIRVKGQGLVRMPGAKSDAGDRVLKLPPSVVSMLRQRKLAAPPGSYPVFPDRLGGWRDPNLVVRWIRWSRDEAGFDWLTSHVWRQSVITALDAAGLNTREVADQAGHSRVEQTNAYMQRKIVSERAAEVLEAMFEPQRDAGG